MTAIANLQNIDLLSVGIAVAGMVVMGFAVLFNDLKSISNRVFFYLALTAGLWGTINYLSYQPYSENISFGLLRLVMFLAIWCSFFTCTFAYVFPNEFIKFPWFYKFIVAPLTTVTAFLSLTPVVFTRVSEFADGRIVKVISGPGILLFALTAIALNLSAIVILARKIKKATKNQHRPLEIVLLGIYLMLFLIIAFNFILPAFFENTRFIPLGALFMFPFIAFTSYAIMKHRLFNVKVVGASILVFALAVLTFLEVMLSHDVGLMIYRSVIFFLVLGFGTMLIRGVLREVQQREQLEVLTKQLEAANKQLKVLDQARSEFITIASHQLRTPPATIKWFLAAVLAGDYGNIDPSVREQLRKTMSTNNSLIALIDDLLNVSRIERGKMEFIYGPTDLVEITKITIDQLLPQAEMKKLELVYNAPKTPLPVITADKEKLRQVINNFIDNAIKYTTTGKIEISTEKVKNDLVLKVTDNGRGVTAAQKPHIFEKFDRGKNPARNSTGLGLGLYVAKVIVEQHKGKIWVESKGEGKGSSFIFSIPILSKLDKSEFDLTKTQTVV